MFRELIGRRKVLDVNVIFYLFSEYSVGVNFVLGNSLGFGDGIIRYSFCF